MFRITAVNNDLRDYIKIYEYNVPSFVISSDVAGSFVSNSPTVSIQTYDNYEPILAVANVGHPANYRVDAILKDDYSIFVSTYRSKSNTGYTVPAGDIVIKVYYKLITIS